MNTKRKVISASTGIHRGEKLYFLQLECGHQATVPAQYDHKRQVMVNPPDKVECERCRAILERGRLEERVEDHLNDLSFQEMSGGWNQDEMEYLLEQDTPTLQRFLTQGFDEIQGWLEKHRQTEAK